jgi:LPXTG-site transpeptidase (sortase) family protein
MKAKAQPSRKKSGSRLGRHSVLYAMAGFVFLAGLLVSWNGLHANRQVAAQVQHSRKVSEATAGQDTQSTQTTAPAPSSSKPAASTIANYTVAPNLPRYIDIPSLKVHTRVLSEGVDSKGALQVPWNIYDTGWYSSSAQPGQLGAMLIDGHSGIGGLHGSFYELSSLTSGDSITITRGDGQTFTYTVVKVQVVDVDSVNMSSMVVSADPTKPGLNLISCAGEQIPGTDELNQRAMVYAVLQ